MAGRVNYYGGIVKDGLILYIDPSRRNSYIRGTNVIYDISGANSNVYTIVNNPTYDLNNNGTFQLNGVNQYINTADVPYRFNNNFSISIWYYWDGINTTAAIFSKRNGQVSFTQYGFTIVESINTGGNSNKVRFVLIPTSGSQNSLFYSMPSAGWYNVLGTVTPNSQALYVNGVIAQTSSVDFSTTNFNVVNRNVIIGGTWNDAGTDVIIPFSGKVSTALLYNRALSASEALQNFNASRSRFGI